MRLNPQLNSKQATKFLSKLIQHDDASSKPLLLGERLRREGEGRTAVWYLLEGQLSCSVSFCCDDRPQRFKGRLKKCILFFLVKVN